MTVNRFWLLRTAQLLAAIVGFEGSLVATAVPTSAKALVVVTQSDGSQKVYHDVFVRVRGSALSLTSSDGKGLLTIGKDDCTEVGELLRCVPSDITLDQHGEAVQLKLRSGTVWLNLSARAQHLSSPSSTVRPHDVMISFRTEDGTTVSANGHIDELQR
jgi:phenylpropionate dioxygenase-like ring-hydroxylating dioxygenase large terminal subunit